MVVNDSGRSSSFNFTPIIMVAAVLMMGGFFLWLSQQIAIEADRQAQIMAEQNAEEEDETPDVSDAVTVELDLLSRDLSRYEGQMVRIEGVGYGGGLGQQGFFADAATPVLFSSHALVADTDNPLTSRGAMILIGTVEEGGRPAFDAWLTDGTIGEGDLMMADFATYYLNVVALEEADGTISTIGDGEDDGGEMDDPGSSN